MDPITMGAISGGVGILGGVLGNIFGGGDRDAAMAAINEMSALYNIPLPDLLKRIEYQQYTEGGQLTPELLTRLAEEEQQVQKLKVNPEIRAKLLKGLAEQEEVAQTGQSAQSRMNLSEVLRKLSGDAQSREKSIIQKFSSSGNLGGGADLASRLLSGQASDQLASESGLRIAADQEKSRSDALERMIRGYKDIENTDTEVSKYNTETQNLAQKQLMMNAINRATVNMNSRTRANESNLARKQQVQDRNTDFYNKEQYRLGHEAPQQMFNNQLSLANGRMGALRSKADQYNNNANATSQMWSQIGGGVGQGIGTYGQFDRNNAIRGLGGDNGGSGGGGGTGGNSPVDFFGDNPYESDDGFSSRVFSRSRPNWGLGG